MFKKRSDVVNTKESAFAKMRAREQQLMGEEVILKQEVVQDQDGSAVRLLKVRGELDEVRAQINHWHREKPKKHDRRRRRI